MIEFKGAVSSKGRQIIRWIEYRMDMIYLLLAYLLVGGGLSLAFAGEYPFETLVAWIGALILMIIFYFCCSISDAVPVRIEIADGKTITSETRKTSMTYEIEEVRLVKDLGDFYVIYVHGVLKNGRFLCQKNLLTQGSLEEFEQVFADKLVRGRNA